MGVKPFHTTIFCRVLREAAPMFWQSLTSTSRLRTTVSIWPVLGTVATSLPHRMSVFRASALTFRFTWPVCTHTQSYSEGRAVLITARCHTVTFCVWRQNWLPVCFPIQLIILPVPPSLLSVFSFLPQFPILFALINPHLLPYYPASHPYCSISHPLPSLIAHNPSHRGQVQITPRGRGFWVFRQRYYLTC